MEVRKQILNSHITGLIQNQAHTSLSVVLGNQYHASVKIGIGQKGF
jgi:hypothetical protein